LGVLGIAVVWGFEVLGEAGLEGDWDGFLPPKGSLFTRAIGTGSWWWRTLYGVKMGSWSVSGASPVVSGWIVVSGLMSEMVINYQLGIGVLLR
jgi:hypothetical protein